jgi:MurNAc alpha-1-phosphate uridylyltransferase
MDAVVMAAGEGRRLRPLTERWAKAVLPLDGRPVIATLLRELAGTGFEGVTVVTGHLGEQIEELVGDGSAFGLSVRYARQPEPLGSADAVRRAVDVGASPPLLVSAADTVFSPGDLRCAAEAWTGSKTEAGLGVRRAPGDPEKTPVRVENGRLVALGEGREDDLAAAPLWFLGAELAASLSSLPGPPFELAEAFRSALADGRKIAALELGPTRDLTRPTDVILGNFPYLESCP